MIKSFKDLEVYQEIYKLAILLRSFVQNYLFTREMTLDLKLVEHQNRPQLILRRDGQKDDLKKSLSCI